MLLEEQDHKKFSRAKCPAEFCIKTTYNLKPGFLAQHFCFRVA
jgi:hypothetical protein